MMTLHRLYDIQGKFHLIGIQELINGKVYQSPVEPIHQYESIRSKLEKAIRAFKKSTEEARTVQRVTTCTATGNPPEIGVYINGELITGIKSVTYQEINLNKN